MTQRFTRDELVARLVRAGELEVAGGDQAEIDSYFDTERFVFHGPGGFETDYAGLTRTSPRSGTPSTTAPSGAA